MGKAPKRKASKVKPPTAPKPKSAKSVSKKNTGSKRKFVELVQADERELSDEDFEDLDDSSHFHDFLQHLDPSSLARKVSKKRQRSSLEDLNKASRVWTTGRNDRDLSKDAGHEEEEDDDHSSVLSSGESLESSSSSSATEIEISATRKPDTIDQESCRRSFKSTLISDRLPIKLSDGTIRQVESTALPPRSANEARHTTAQKAATTQDDKSALTVTEEEEILTPAERLRKTQETLAKVAMEIIEDPEENIEKLRHIKEIQRSGSLEEQHYAILTLSAIFKDVIPGYRIRPLTDVEKAEKITKEVRRLRNFEQNLVEHYKVYVESLNALTKTARNAQSSSRLKTTAVTAACTLLRAAPHFNFRTELFHILVNQVARKRVDDSFTMCRETIEEMFREDEEGEASFEGMRQLCKKLRDRDYQVDESTIGMFLHLRLLTNMEARGSTDKIERVKERKKDRQFRTKKLRKLLKENKEVENDMREAQATVDAETRERLQGETLKLTFATYFRILKQANRGIIGAALEGLAKFASLINVDFFGDLLVVLKELMMQEEAGLTTREVLLCIVTSFTLLSGQATTKETMNLDLSVFMGKLYMSLLPTAFNAGVESSEKDLASDEAVIERNKVDVATEMEMVLRALDALFFKHRIQQTTRLLAFFKRLSIVSLNLPEKSAIAAIELSKRLVTRYSKLHTLYATEERAGDGAYDGTTDNFELCNPTATSIWEVALLRNHFSPKIRNSSLEVFGIVQEGSKVTR